MVGEVLWVAADDIRAAAQLIDYGLDSPTAIELTIQLEQAFGIEIPEDAASQLNSVDDIVATALANIATHTPLRVEIRGTDWEHRTPITNIGVIKSVHFAGGMYYDTPVTRADGHFDVNIWDAVGRARILALIAGLYRGKFSTSSAAICHRDTAVELRPDRPAPLELDGEITVVESARLEVLPRVLKVCAA
ncbi:phosphopantetheine-binding protein [Nocardia sp. NBC_01377]